MKFWWQLEQRKYQVDGLAQRPSAVDGAETNAHGRARRGSMLGLMSSLLEGSAMSRILALQNRHVRDRQRCAQATQFISF